MAEGIDACFLKHLGRCGSTKKLASTAPDRIEKASIQRGDQEHKRLQELLTASSATSVKVHKSCIDSYASQINIKSWHLKHTHPIEHDDGMSPKCSKSSDSFDFKRHCLFSPGKFIYMYILQTYMCFYWTA